MHSNSWSEIIKSYSDRRVIGMMFLGFSAGLPFPLVFTTLTTWLRDVGIERATIGFFAWIGITYSIKVFWSPVVDRVSLPFVTRVLGQRRGWMLVAQLGISLGLLGMALTDPTSHITLMAICSLLVAFSSATQDVSIDAYRIEAVNPQLHGPMAGMYLSGYRIAAALVGGAGALYLAEWTSWQTAYFVMIACMSIGIITVLLIREPEHSIHRGTQQTEQRVIEYLQANAHLIGIVKRFNAWFIGAVICPFVDFFKRNGKYAYTILAFIAIYRISDIVLGNMAYPFYIDMCFTKPEIANVSKIFGVVMTIVGSVSGGVLVIRFGLMQILLVGAIFSVLTNLLYIKLVFAGHDLAWLTVVISADNFTAGLAGSAFIAYLSRLTNTAYTATQYALFSSLMTLFPKIISGFSGVVVDQFEWMYIGSFINNVEYIGFFIYASALGIPSIVMVLYMMYRERHVPRDDVLQHNKK